jgi:uncharacterized protein YerC
MKYVIKLKEFRDLHTGEVIQLEEIHKQCSSKPFWKVYLADFLPLLGLVMESQQLNVVIYILEKLKPSENIFIGTYRNISKETGISLSTVTRIIKKLQNTKINNEPMIKKINHSVWMVSPHLLVQGGDKKKQSIMLTWEQVSKEEADNPDYDIQNTK